MPLPRYAALADENLSPSHVHHASELQIFIKSPPSCTALFPDNELLRHEDAITATMLGYEVARPRARPNALASPKWRRRMRRLRAAGGGRSGEGGPLCLRSK